MPSARGTEAQSRRLIGCLGAGLALLLLGGCRHDPLDRELRALVGALDLASPERPPASSPERVRLGEALFFDKELSGNRDVACATCHHPTEHSTDGLSLPVGVGGRGLGAQRELGEGRRFVPRHSPDLFNRAARGWTTLFWDGRVEAAADGGIASPAGASLPAELDGVLAAQAMFPVTSRDEMRGAESDVDLYGRPNELAAIPDDDYAAIWDALVRRLLSTDAYVELFAAAYPGVGVDAIGFEHAANAIAAYEAEAFWFTASPWDAYLEGDDSALTEQEKRGALLFFGRGRCVACHSGPLFTDQRFHNVAAPQVGPGKGPSAPLDLGRALVTGVDADRCAFRTPSLRNVGLTGPWMHDGAYTDLESAVRHMANPSEGLLGYDESRLTPALRETVLTGAQSDSILATLDPMVSEGCGLSSPELADLLTFLGALTDPAAVDLSHLVPTSVPSGLPVDGVPDPSPLHR